MQLMFCLKKVFLFIVGVQKIYSYLHFYLKPTALHFGNNSLCSLCSGLSLTGSHLMCGDFLYSGHTVMLTLSYLFIKECEQTQLSSHSLLSPAQRSFYFSLNSQNLIRYSVVFPGLQTPPSSGATQVINKTT